MKPNIGSTDKIIRIVAALLIVILYFFNVISGTLGIILLIVAALLIITSLISFCPLYPILKINTISKKKE